MSSARQNRSIARLIVGAMSIDGSLSKAESEKVAQTLNQIGMGELVADVGAVIEENEIEEINLFAECKALRESLGADADELSPMVFRIIADVVAHDRFVSEREAGYLSAMSRRLEIPNKIAQEIFKQVMLARRGRLEVAGRQIDASVNPHLKELLSFSGAEGLVGDVNEDSLSEIAYSVQQALAEGERISHDDFESAMTILGLDGTAKLEDAAQVWHETINNLNLPKMAGLGETFVSAAIARITRINDAYKTILHFHTKAKTPVPAPKKQ